MDEREDQHVERRDEPEHVVREAEVIFAGGEDRPPEENHVVPAEDDGRSVVDHVKTSGAVGLGCIAALVMVVMMLVTAIVVGIPLAIARALKGKPDDG